jgi:hypothetical protein
MHKSRLINIIIIIIQFNSLFYYANSAATGDNYESAQKYKINTKCR